MSEQSHLPPPFQVRTCGLINRSPVHSTPGTKDGDIMLTAFIAGRGVYQNNQGRRIVEGGAISLITPEDPGVLAADAKDPYLHYFCRFSGTYARQMAYNIIAARGDCFFHEEHIDEVADLLRSIGPYSSRTLPEQLGPRELKLAQILVLLSGKRLKWTTPRLNAHTILEYLNERISEPTNLDAMANYFGVSKATLCRAAQRECGNTVQQLHEKMKMDWACTLLVMEMFPVREISLRVGYNDPLYFSRVFRKHCNLGPRQWRQQQRDRQEPHGEKSV